MGAKVAVIDIDAHHGNGTQAIFYEDPSVLVGSVHVDPGAGWFPTSRGSPRRRAAGGEPQRALAPGSGDEGVAEAVRAGGWARAGGAEALVVALGVDAAAGDPRARWR